MARVPGRGRIVALAVAIAMCGLVMLGATSPARAEGLRAAERCGRPLVVAVRGSGEKRIDFNGMGETVYRVVQRFRELWGRPVEVDPIDYPASPVSDLFKDIVSPGFARDPYRGSVDTGTKLVRDRLTNGARACPKRPIVLVGYSQGALVINRALVELAGDRAPALRGVASIELIADPQRIGGASYTEGDAPRSASGASLSTGFYPADDLPKLLRSGTDSFCRKHDPVCALEPNVVARLANPVLAPATITELVVDAKRVHTTYKNTDLVDDAGTFAASRTRKFIKHPLPDVEPVTVDSLENAELPRDGVCGEGYVQDLPTPLRLVDGEVPGIPVGAIGLTVPPSAIGDFDGDGVDDGAINVSCNAGGTAVEQDVVVYTAARGLIGGLPFDAVRASENRTPIIGPGAMSVNDGVLQVHWIAGTPNDPRCCGSIDVTGRFRVTRNRIKAVDQRLLKADSVVTTDGYGAVTFGMTLSEAEVASGLPWRYLSGLDNHSGCSDYVPEGAPNGVSFMVIDEVIARVDVTSPAIRTKSGLGIGTSQADILRRFPSAAVTPHAYNPGGNYVAVTDRATGNKVVFVTDGRTVTDYHAGRSPEVEYIEGCL